MPHTTPVGEFPPTLLSMALVDPRAGSIFPFWLEAWPICDSREVRSSGDVLYLFCGPGAVGEMRQFSIESDVKVPRRIRVSR